MPNMPKIHHSIYVTMLLALPLNALAGGFGVTVQSGSIGGNAATGHALAEDASAMWYNPALLSSLEGKQVNGGLSFVHTKLDVVNTGSTTPASGALVFPIVGDNTVDPGGTSITPSLFYKRDLGKQGMAFGLGINVPFGVNTEYENDSFTRYEATESQLKTVNINPAISYRVNEKFDVGAGLNLQIGQATLGRKLDSFLLCTQSAPTATCQGVFGGASNQSFDNDVTIEADGIGYGVNAGFAYRPNQQITVSVGLRSSVNYDLEGDADFELNQTFLTLLGGNASGVGLVDQDAEASLKMPASASFAFARELSNKLTIHGDVTWTQWSSVPEIRIKFPNTTLSDSVTNTQWDDTTRVGLGMTYKMTPKTTLRTGIALDPTPTPGPENRTPRAPSSDNLWLSGGVSHQINKKIVVDASLSLVHPEEVAINYSAPAPTDYLTRAETESDVLVGAVSVNYRF